jgi:hypothetical protein
MSTSVAQLFGIFILAYCDKGLIISSYSGIEMIEPSLQNRWEWYQV